MQESNFLGIYSSGCLDEVGPLEERCTTQRLFTDICCSLTFELLLPQEYALSVPKDAYLLETLKE